MDTAIIRTLFKDCAKAAGLLGTDKELAEKLTYISDKMLPYQISAKGGLMEWSQDFPEVYKDHRHLSHLYGLYPGEEIHTEKYKFGGGMYKDTGTENRRRPRLEQGLESMSVGKAEGRGTGFSAAARTSHPGYRHPDELYLRWNL